MAVPASDGNSIRVAIRCRPFNGREHAEGAAGEPVVSCWETAVTVNGDGPSSRPVEAKTFNYDHVFSSTDTQETVFEAVGTQLLENALNAYNGCIFAYGQTGSGKSHSMVGNLTSEEEKGLLPRSCVRLFEMLASRSQGDGDFQATVLASYLEIYNEKLFDLLSSSGREAGGELQVRLHPNLGAIVVGLTECPMGSFDEALELFDFGAKRRAVGATQMNAASSRSHAVFTVQIRTLLRRAGGSVESQAKIHFVDLAGSEKQKKSGATGARLKEGIGINQSLTTLGRVISDLTKPGGKAVPPFRDSKLTLLLKDALMGNSRTELLACISPSRFNLDETVSTLEFASRCKLVKTSAKKNEQSRVDVIAKLTTEKELIEAQLQQEKVQSEELCRQLQQEIERAAEKQQAAERALEEKQQIEERLRLMEGERGELEQTQSEREKLLKEKEELLREKEQEQELKQRNQAELEAQREELQRTQELLKEKEQLLQQDGAKPLPEEGKPQGNSVQELQQRLAELERQEQQQEAWREQELRCRLEEERKAQEARQQELASQLDALKAVQESWALDQAQIDKKREAQHQHREHELSKLGMHFLGVEGEDMAHAPRLVNLHPDPALKGCLIYYLPVGETSIGSDAERCRVRLAGLGVGAEVCAISNEDNESLRVRPLDSGLVRVNGSIVGDEGQQLCDGDRLAVGRACIFQVHIPRAARDAESTSHAESEFERAMGEIAACAEVDPQWENGVQKAMLLVKSDFGTEAANQLLEQARRASEAIAMANVVLHEMPEGWTDGVAKYELTVMFDAHGLPGVCIVARRDHGAGGSSQLRSGALGAGIWEVEQFMNERLPMMHEALLLAKGGEDPGVRHWESRVWSELSIHDYRALASELTRSESRREQMEAERAGDSPRDHGWSWLSGAAAQLKQNVKAVKHAVKETTAAAALLDAKSEARGEPEALRAPRPRGSKGNPSVRGLARAVSPAGLFRSISSGRLERPILHRAELSRRIELHLQTL